MNSQKFTLIMYTKIEGITTKMVNYLNISYKEALKLLYNSQLYEVLEDEETKMWYYSDSELFNMYLQEKETGTFTICGG